ncbi:unnamed protein product, partial [Prorocentrum cordatum]
MAELRKWPTPEILSKSLEEVVMQLLALGLGDPHEMLARSLSTPSVACIEHAVWLLQEMSMMNEKEGMSARDALTPMGRWLAPIPLHPMSSKALLYASLFGVLLPVTAMIAFLNIKSPFVASMHGQPARGGKHFIVGDKRSDHYAMAAAYLSWRSRSCVGDGDSYINEHSLSLEALTMGDKMVKSLLRLMVDEYDYDGDDANFIEDAGTGSWTPEAVFDPVDLAAVQGRAVLRVHPAVRALSCWQIPVRLERGGGGPRLQLQPGLPAEGQHVRGHPWYTCGRLASVQRLHEAREGEHHGEHGRGRPGRAARREEPRAHHGAARVRRGRFRWVAWDHRRRRDAALETLQSARRQIDQHLEGLMEDG